METLEERRNIDIEKLMEYTDTYNQYECGYSVETILKIMVYWDIIPDYNLEKLLKLLFGDEYTIE